MAKVSVSGLGYIGLPTAVIAATAGHEVTGFDIKPEIVENLNDGKLHLEEPGLEEALHKTLKAGTFEAVSTLQPADVFLIAVPTPFIEADKRPDMRFVEQAAAAVAKVVVAGNLVVLESTSPVGATQKHVADIIEAKRPELRGKVHFVYCPERAIPGKTMYELVHNDRVVGGLTPEATAVGESFYKTFVKGDLLGTAAGAAELVKLTENASRDVSIAFANELSLVCDKLGLDVWEVIKLANHHPRVNILQPGPGVGGHCLAVDPWFIVSSAPEVTPLIKTAREVNDNKPDWVVSKIKQAAAKFDNPTITLLGLAYKPDVDDFRESPAMLVAEKLKSATNARVVACEPYLQQADLFELLPLDEAVAQGDVIVMLTDHKEFKNITRGQLEGKQVIDTRGALSA